MAGRTSQVTTLRGSATRVGIKRNHGTPFIPLPPGRTPVWSHDRPPIAPSPRLQLLPGEVFAGRYEVVSFVVEGGFSHIYRVRELTTGRDLALKIACGEHPETLEAESRIIRALSEKLNNPHLVRFHEAGTYKTESGSINYLLMEFIDGLTVKDIIKQRREISLPEALEMTFLIASALRLAYNELGVCNNDLKPENILRRSNGKPVLIDWGLAEFIPNEDEIAGSPTFMAPERFRTATTNDPRSDIYSLGVTLYCMIRGRMPFLSPADQLRELMAEKDHSLPEIPGLPKSAQRLIDRMTAPDISERPQNYDELLTEIDSVRKELSSTTYKLKVFMKRVAGLLKRKDSPPPFGDNSLPPLDENLSPTVREVPA